MRFAEPYKIKFISRKSLSFDNVYIEPQYSDILSRKDVKTGIVFDGENSSVCLKLNVPIIGANMDTICENRMCTALWNSGAIGSLHRFMSIEDNVKEYRKVINEKANCFVSIGVNQDAIERATRLYESGAKYFIIDIAHGHSILMKETISKLRNLFGRNIMIVAGNVATRGAMLDLKRWGADVGKCGIGPGSTCSTKDVTGCTVPQFSAILNCCEQTEIQVIGDGGFRVIGDVAKAIGVGATAAMSGFFFAGAEEIPERFKIGEEAVYRGMASMAAMKLLKANNFPTPEGKELFVEKKGSAKDIVENIAGGLRSAMSYSGARTIKEFQEEVVFGTK